ncbi:MAG TPA: hypothetical protein ENI99_12865 [Sedimenticola sp.]|nr:hypothetical protein [Sedimenticola sp.]
MPEFVDQGKVSFLGGFGYVCNNSYSAVFACAGGLCWRPVGLSGSGGFPCYKKTGPIFLTLSPAWRGFLKMAWIEGATETGCAVLDFLQGYFDLYQSALQQTVLF